MNHQPKSKTDQLVELFGRTFLLWRATPLVGFSSKSPRQLVQDLRLYLMNEFDYEPYDGSEFDAPEKPTIMEARLVPLRFDDWDKVNESSQVLELDLDIWHPRNKISQKHSLYFLPATLARNTNESMTDAVDYPLLLAKFKNGDVAQNVKQWLKNDFGCNITKFHVSGSVMTSLVNWWTASLYKVYDFESHASMVNKKCLQLSYYISFTENLDSISFTITMDQLRKMHNLIQGTSLTTMDLIQEHIYKTLRIKVDHCILTQVGTPMAYISNESQLKLLPDGGSKVQYLEFLSELCDLAGTSF